MKAGERGATLLVVLLVLAMLAVLAAAVARSAEYRRASALAYRAGEEQAVSEQPVMVSLP